MNPPNCPQLRPIESYWAIVKKLLKKTSQTADNSEKMLPKLNNCAGKVSEDVVRSMMAGILRKIKFFFLSQDL